MHARRSLLSGIALAICLNPPNAEIWNGGVIEVHCAVNPEMQMAGSQVEVAVWTPVQRIAARTSRGGLRRSTPLRS